jgi:hypothetical protein
MGLLDLQGIPETTNSTNSTKLYYAFSSTHTLMTKLNLVRHNNRLTKITYKTDYTLSYNQIEYSFSLKYVFILYSPFLSTAITENIDIITVGKWN